MNVLRMSYLNLALRRKRPNLSTVHTGLSSLNVNIIYVAGCWLQQSFSQCSRLEQSLSDNT